MDPDVQKALTKINKQLAELDINELIDDFVNASSCVGYPNPRRDVGSSDPNYIDPEFMQDIMDELELSHLSVKAPQDIIADLPQERITGDVLRGYGPRRGNLERLLRYWRPIMRKPGGFRRCRVILADHPELYPLENICAWLHHETTGLWPNEGCHHPGMKNCRKKIRGVRNGSIISNEQFENRMQRLRRGSKTLEEPDIPQEMLDGAANALKDFMIEEKMFCKYLQDDNNWMHEGLDEKGQWVQHSAD